MSPWKRIEDWQRNDKSKEQSTLEYINSDMQNKFPGSYRVVKKLTPANGWNPTYVIVFDNPAEESMFRLRFS